MSVGLGWKLCRRNRWGVYGVWAFDHQDGSATAVGAMGSNDGYACTIHSPLRNANVSTGMMIAIAAV